MSGTPGRLDGIHLGHAPVRTQESAANASFELDFGQAKHGWIRYNPGESTSESWTDFLNPMPLPLA
mgnify:CR=1 FL=1|jgi:hypothetical protein